MFFILVVNFLYFEDILRNLLLILIFPVIML